MGTVGEIGVVAGVFDYDGLGPCSAEITPLHLELDASLPAFTRQLHFDAGLRPAAREPAGCCLCGRGGAGARGPSCPEILAFDLLHARGHGRFAELTWRHLLPSGQASSGGTCARRRGCRDESAYLRPRARDRPVSAPAW